jgi:hypothetical protein
MWRVMHGLGVVVAADHDDLGADVAQAGELADEEEAGVEVTPLAVEDVAGEDEEGGLLLETGVDEADEGAAGGQAQVVHGAPSRRPRPRSGLSMWRSAAWTTVITRGQWHPRDRGATAKARGIAATRAVGLGALWISRRGGRGRSRCVGIAARRRSRSDQEKRGDGARVLFHGGTGVFLVDRG